MRAYTRAKLIRTKLKSATVSVSLGEINSDNKKSQSRFWGRGCDEALFSEKKGVFSEKGGGNSVNQRFGKDFYRKGNSVKRSGRFNELPDFKN